MDSKSKSSIGISSEPVVNWSMVYPGEKFLSICEYLELDVICAFKIHCQDKSRINIPGFC
jgi:hypothetical protein